MQAAHARIGDRIGDRIGLPSPAPDAFHSVRASRPAAVWRSSRHPAVGGNKPNSAAGRLRGAFNLLQRLSGGLAHAFVHKEGAQQADGCVKKEDVRRSE